MPAPSIHAALLPAGHKIGQEGGLPKDHHKEREKRLYVAWGNRTRSQKFLLMYRISIRPLTLCERRVGGPRK